jgi:hypothetical protein
MEPVPGWLLFVLVALGLVATGAAWMVPRNARALGMLAGALGLSAAILAIVDYAASK